MPAPKLSRYEFSPVEQDSAGRFYLGVPDPKPKGVLVRGASPHKVVASDTLHSLAWVAYQDLLNPEQDVRPTSFFDVIGRANSVVDPTQPLPVGSIFQIPTVEVLLGDDRVPPAFSGANRVN